MGQKKIYVHIKREDNKANISKKKREREKEMWERGLKTSVGEHNY